MAAPWLSSAHQPLTLGLMILMIRCGHSSAGGGMLLPELVLIRMLEASLIVLQGLLG